MKGIGRVFFRHSRNRRLLPRSFSFFTYRPPVLPPPSRPQYRSVSTEVSGYSEAFNAKVPVHRVHLVSKWLVSPLFTRTSPIQPGQICVSYHDHRYDLLSYHMCKSRSCGFVLLISRSIQLIWVTADHRFSPHYLQNENQIARATHRQFFNEGLSQFSKRNSINGVMY